MYDIRHKPRTTHAPWTNGLVEGTNRYLGEYLRTTCENGHADWNERAKAFALAYNITTRSKMDLSPYELVFMEKPRIPATFYLNLDRNRFDDCITDWCAYLLKHSRYLNHFHHPKLKQLQKGTFTEWYLSRERMHADVFKQLAEHLKNIVVKQRKCIIVLVPQHL